MPHNIKKKQMIILSVCHAGVVTRQVHRTTSQYPSDQSAIDQLTFENEWVNYIHFPTL